MTTIYFIRHAEPNRSPDGNDATFPLSEKGLADRSLVTAFLKDKEIDVVLSSPFKRAVDTVADFAAQAKLSVRTIDDFRERKIFTEWIDDFNSYVAKQWADFSYKLDGGESLSEVQARNIAALRAVLKQYKDKNIVIGTHGTALSTIIQHFDHRYGLDDFKSLAMPHAVKMVFDGESCVEIDKIDLFKINLAP